MLTDQARPRIRRSLGSSLAAEPSKLSLALRGGK